MKFKFVWYGTNYIVDIDADDKCGLLRYEDSGKVERPLTALETALVRAAREVTARPTS